MQWSTHKKVNVHHTMPPVTITWDPGVRLRHHITMLCVHEKSWQVIHLKHGVCSCSSNCCKYLPCNSETWYIQQLIQPAGCLLRNMPKHKRSSSIRASLTGYPRTEAAAHSGSWGVVGSFTSFSLVPHSAPALVSPAPRDYPSTTQIIELHPPTLRVETHQ